jgi:hypothetical protein
MYVSGRLDANTMQLQLTDADCDKWRVCDSCHAVANAALIERDPISGPEPDAEFSSPFDAIKRAFEGLKSSPDPDYAAIMSQFTARMPEPETREERLIKTIIRQQGRDGSSQSTAAWAAWLVHAARSIEREMEKPNSSTSLTSNYADSIASWRTLKFSARIVFITWMANLLDRTRPSFGSGWDSTSWAAAMADALERSDQVMSEKS